MKLKIFFLIVVAFILVSTINAQNTPQTVIIKIWEVEMNGVSKIYITDASGNTKIIELENITFKTQESAISNNNVKLQNELNKLKRDGFEIKSTYQRGAYTTIIMSKD